MPAVPSPESAGSSPRSLPAPPRMQRTAPRIGIVVLTALIALLAGAGTALAHVTVTPKTSQAGTTALLTFKVPTESATATTVSLQVSLPTDHPFASVSALQVPGWTVTLDKTTLSAPVTEGDLNIKDPVTTVTWKADDGVGVPIGEFMQFVLSVGPVPDVPSLSFPATQTYSDGSVVKWADPVVAGQPEPDHPAPVLTVTPANASTSGTATDTVARTWAIVSTVVAVLALLFSLFLAVRGLRRRPTNGAS